MINQRHSADENAIENTSLIADVLSNDNEIESVELLFGEDVQWFIDVMDQVLAHSSSLIVLLTFPRTFRNTE